MKLSEALKIVGGLGKTSKMPCPSYSLSPDLCNTGGKLRSVEGSVCSSCYACKGSYRYPNVRKAHIARHAAMADPRWADAMVTAITRKKLKFFRWHDAGDLQGMAHLEAILYVVLHTSFCKHWLPTKESKLIRDYLSDGGQIPDNLVIRVSSPLIDSRPLRFYPNTSTVHRKKEPYGFRCTAESQGGKCADCRACWDKSVPNISYHYH